jgi:hypothetical protein
MTRTFVPLLALCVAACVTPQEATSAAGLRPDPLRAAGAATTADVAMQDLARFQGTWEGTGTATEADGSTSARQLFMTLVLDDTGGFALGWATLIGAELGPGRLRKTVVQFIADGPSGSWRGREQQSGAAGTLYHAGVVNGVLTVAASGTNEDGQFETQIYSRSFDAEGGMQLAFQRQVAGKTVRTVTGRLLMAPPAMSAPP